MSHNKGLIERIVGASLGGTLPIFIFVAAIAAGVLALQLTPREEEPQIVVPMLDVLVDAAGLSAQQMERQVTIPLEKLLAQIPGVEHIYSSSMTGQASVTLRFFVGEDREKSILNTYNKLYSNQDKMPPVVGRWMVSPVEVDDLPIVLLGLWSDDPLRYSDFELRRMADEVSTHLQAIPDTSVVEVTGGRPRTLRILLDPESMGARKTTASDIINALHVSNVLQSAGDWSIGNKSVVLEGGDVFRSVEELRTSVVNVIDGVPVYLLEVASIEDGPAEPTSYNWIGFANQESDSAGDKPMVSISVAKQAGSNAVQVAENVHQRMAELKQELLPPEVHIETLRDYGQTANDKVNQLTSSLAFAVLTVVIFIGVFLGWRPALVVGLAVPICYGITLALDLAMGYTINRVTLFALILSLGLLVDDPITGVDNIERHLEKAKGSIGDSIVAAINEIRIPLLMSTLTIILAFVPLAFITGMMGPYMAPMAFNVPISVTASTVVAFLVTPWLAKKILKTRVVKDEPQEQEKAGLLVFYRRVLIPMLDDRRKAKWVLWSVLGLFIVAALLPVFRLVPLKLLPFDNKSEVQIVIDMPEGTTLEQTASMARTISQEIQRVPEVNAVAAFVGEPSAIDFNGMVRRYYQRIGPHMADLRVTLVDKSEREHQSHAVVLRIRELLSPLAVDDIKIRVVEVPPGPPVMSTLVAEIYADTLVPYAAQQQAAALVMERLAREPHVVEIDSSVGGDQERLRFITDKQKAALSGISTEDVNSALLVANQGYIAGFLHLDRETVPLPIELRLPVNERTSSSDMLRLQVKGRPGIVKQSSANGLETAPQPLVALGELGQFESELADKPILHKDLKPVVYVMAELSGRTPAEIVADVHADLGAPQGAADDWQGRNFLFAGSGDGWELPQGVNLIWGGEGEWKITVRVFRDMGLAFAFALVAIFLVLRVQTASSAMSLIIMSSIPLTIIGIMPGFWLLNQFGEREIASAPEPILFTATAM
ncbi:MAG: efflux RND transporter permease subunit, partial [Pseudomonadales bacterium]